MIHHVSMTAYNPSHVAHVLAELLQGQAVPFPQHPGSFVALSLDNQGTMIEVLPRSVELRPGLDNQPAQWSTNYEFSLYSGVHAAISVPVEAAQIRDIADRERWRMVCCDRGEDYFTVIELWVENHQLIELLPPKLTAKYLTFMQPQQLQQFLSK